MRDIRVKALHTPLPQHLASSQTPAICVTLDGEILGRWVVFRM